MAGNQMVEGVEKGKKAGVVKSVIEKIKPEKKQPAAPAYLGGILENNPHLQTVLENFENKYKKLSKNDAQKLIDEIYIEYKAALARGENETASNLFNIIQKLQAKTGLSVTEKMTRAQYAAQTIPPDEAIKIISIDMKKGIQKIWFDNLTEPETAALILELNKRGISWTEDMIDKFAQKLYNKNPDICAEILSGKTPAEIIDGMIPQELRETYDEYKGNTIGDTINKINGKINELQEQVKKGYYFDVKVGNQIKNLETLKNKLTQIDVKDMEAFYLLSKKINEMATKEIEKMHIMMYENRPFSFKNMTGLFKKGALLSCIAGSAYGIFELTDSMWPPVALLTLLGGGYRVARGLGQTEGVRAKIRKVGPEGLIWLALVSGSIYMAVSEKNRTEKEKWKKLKEEYGFSDEQLKNIKKFVETKEGEETINYLNSLREKVFKEKERLDFKKLAEWLDDKEALGTFKNFEVFVKALLELEPLVKGKSGVKLMNEINSKINDFKQKGYLYNKGETVLFEMGRALGLTAKQAEELLSSKENKKAFFELLKAVYEGRLPQTYAMFYDKENEEKLKTQYPIMNNSVIDHFDRYTLAILTDSEKTTEEKINAKKKFDEIMHYYNTNESFRQRLNNNVVGPNEAVYGDMYGFVSAIMRGDISISDARNVTNIGKGYLVADGLLAQLDPRFLEDLKAVKFVMEYQLMDYFKKQIKEGMISIDSYGLTKILENNVIFKNIESKERREKWLDDQIKSLLKPYQKNNPVKRTYMSKGIETHPEIKTQESKEKGRPPASKSITPTVIKRPIKIRNEKEGDESF